MRSLHAVVRCAPLVLLLALLAWGERAEAWSASAAVNTRVAVQPGSQDSIQAVSDGLGGVLFAWHDTRNASHADIYAQRLTGSGAVAVGWVVDGLPICVAADQQLAPVICSDGNSGAIIAWQDYRAGNFNIMAQRIRANGTVAWAVDGIVVCNAVNDQTAPDIVSDGVGGAIITWEDRRAAPANPDIRAARITSTGVLAPGWIANGNVIVTSAGEQIKPRITTDMLNGAVIAWQDRRGADYDIYATRILGGGSIAAGFVANGVALCAFATDQITPRVDSDSTSGAVVTWEDHRGADYDIYAQRVDAAGLVMWAVNGAIVCNAPSNQTGPIVVADGIGGGIIGWTDSRPGVTTDIYAQLMTPGGVAAWMINGVLVCGAADNQVLNAMDRDCGSPWGAFLTWVDNRNVVSTDIYVGRVTAVGTVPGVWAGGIAVGTAANNQLRPDLIYDGINGAIVGFTDLRAGNDNLFAQKITCPGAMGNPNPGLAVVQDVPNDQGGQVTVAWSASPREAAIANAGSSGLEGVAYHVWRMLPIPQPDIDYWELVASVPARGFSGYSLTVPTTGDSIENSNPMTTFLVQFEDSDGSFYNSDPMTGYSVDNLSPPPPQQFTGYATGAGVKLSWLPTTDGDLREYRLHRGTTADFVPSMVNLASAQPDTGFVDTSGQIWHYKLAAVDIHGNIGRYVALSPQQVSGGPTSPGKASLWLGRAAPNPFRGTTAVEFALPAGGNARVAIHDVTGRLVRVLTDGLREAGTHQVVWDGRDDGGTAAAGGLYFYRLEAGGEVRSGRVMLTR